MRFRKSAEHFVYRNRHRNSDQARAEIYDDGGLDENLATDTKLHKTVFFRLFIDEVVTRLPLRTLPPQRTSDNYRSARVPKTHASNCCTAAPTANQQALEAQATEQFRGERPLRPTDPECFPCAKISKRLPGKVFVVQKAKSEQCNPNSGERSRALTYLRADCASC
ncbi:hypothetical protein EVAR_70030_1 [Eumeta japonica]|uniref:Uncharacterized protein n=1 Tax=Eumeta variegata TaxID=151549 RepID=A0A4C1ZZZ0_EUMVA|nr:hypothetical protein EVAR_70030_1 [Eumeta japonica]